MNNFYSYCIYYSPIDYPEQYVVRKFDSEIPMGLLYIGSSLDMARSFIPPGMIKIYRNYVDHLSVIETWI